MQSVAGIWGCLASLALYWLAAWHLKTCLRVPNKSSASKGEATGIEESVLGRAKSLGQEAVSTLLTGRTGKHRVNSGPGAAEPVEMQAAQSSGHPKTPPKNKSLLRDC